MSASRGLAGRRPVDPEGSRAVVVASRLYHVHGLRQRQIAERMGTSQARVSRLLRQAAETGVTRTVVAVPEGVDSELEEAIEARYDVQEVHVVAAEDGADLARVLGLAAAAYLGEAGLVAATVGYTSWSTTLQVMAQALAPALRPTGGVVVEMLGDLGSPLRQHAAARATQDMARALGAAPVFLRVPGVLGSAELAAAVTRDPHVRHALALNDHLDVALVGVGPADLHSTLEPGDGFFTPEQLRLARVAGAVGQINQRFLDARGRPLRTELDDLVVGCTLEQVAAAGRRVVVAGGPEKRAALAAALTGGWVDLLVTDSGTARALLDRPAVDDGQVAGADS